MPSNYLPVPMSPLSGSAGRRQRSYPMMTRASSPVGPAPGYSQNSGSEQMTDPTVSGTTTPMPSRVTVRRTSAPMLPMGMQIKTGPAPGMYQGAPSPTVNGSPSISGGTTRMPSAPMLSGGTSTVRYPMAPNMPAQPTGAAPLMYSPSNLPNRTFAHTALPARADQNRREADYAIAATKKPNVETQGRSGQVGESAIKEMWLNTAKGDVAKFAALGRKWGFNHEALLKKWEGEGAIFEHDVNNPNRPEPQYVARGEYPGKVYPARTPQQQQDVTDRRLAYAKEQNAKADELEAQYAAANAPPAQPAQPEDARVQVARIQQEGLNQRNDANIGAKAKEPVQKPPTASEIAEIARKIWADSRESTTPVSPIEAISMAREFLGMSPAAQPTGPMPTPALGGGSGPTLNPPAPTGAIALGPPGMSGKPLSPATQPSGQGGPESPEMGRLRAMAESQGGQFQPDGTMVKDVRMADGSVAKKRFRRGVNAQGQSGWEEIVTPGNPALRQ